MTRDRKMLLGLALLFGLFLNSGAASAAECQARIDQELQRLSVPAESVESVKVTKRTGGARSGANYSYDAWVKLKSCDSGHLVVNLTKYCMPTQNYTIGGCSVPGVSGY